MEIPRYRREVSTNLEFKGREKKLKDSGLVYFKYPGGEILLNGTYLEVKERFLRKGFEVEVAKEILWGLFIGGISTEASVAVSEVLEGFQELLRTEIGK